MSLLGRITGPTDLKELSTATLADLAQGIRTTTVLKRLASTHRRKVTSKEM